LTLFDRARSSGEGTGSYAAGTDTPPVDRTWFQGTIGILFAASSRRPFGALIIGRARNCADAFRQSQGAFMPVQMELSRIIISEINDQQVIYLKEVDGDRTFPILIGIFEATSIDRRVKQYHSPRPLTHDLLVNIVENLGAELQDVVISELKDHTYFAKLRVRHEGELIEIDSRPSDAIAVAVTCDPQLPIYVSEEVLNDVLGEQ
jgi:bifunctional DNase/RNase